MTPLLDAVLQAMCLLRSNGIPLADRAGRIYTGAPGLQLDARLSVAAQVHAQDLRDRQYFAHASPEGRLAAWRVEAAGFAWSHVSELLSGGIDDAETLVRGWQHSPEHCAGMMDHRFTHVGLGHANPGALVVVVLAATA